MSASLTNRQRQGQVFVWGTKLMRDNCFEVPEKSCSSKEEQDMTTWEWKRCQWALEARVILKMYCLFILLYKPTKARVTNGNCLFMNENVP